MFGFDDGAIMMAYAAQALAAAEAASAATAAAGGIGAGMAGAGMGALGADAASFLTPMVADTTGTMAATTAAQQAATPIAETIAASADAALPTFDIAAAAPVETVVADVPPASPPITNGPATTPSITDRLSGYADKIGSTLTSPEFLLPLALQAGGAMMGSSAYGDIADTQLDKYNTAKSVVGGEQDKLNKAVVDYGQNSLSPEAIKRNTDEAYTKLATDFVANQDKAKQDLGAITGNTPDEFAKAMAESTARAKQQAGDYARGQAKIMAPSLADLTAGINELKANRTVANSMSDMRQAGALGYTALGKVDGNNKLPIAATLSGLGNGLSTIYGR